MASPMLNKLSNLLAEAQQQADLVAASLTRSEVEHREAVERAWKANHNTQAELLSIKASRDSLVCSLKDMTKQRDAALAELGAVTKHRDALVRSLNPPTQTLAVGTPVYCVDLQEHSLRYGHVAKWFPPSAMECAGYAVVHRIGRESCNVIHAESCVFTSLHSASVMLANQGKNL